MKSIKTITLGLCLSGVLLGGHAQAASEEVIDAIEGYLMFTEYSGATMRPEQIPAEEWENIFVIDTRDAEQYAEDHIPGAVNIEWRHVLDRRDEIPTDRQVLVYCNTGSLSSQAGLILRLAGYENVRILQGGFEGWKEAGGFESHERALQEAQ